MTVWQGKSGMLHRRLDCSGGPGRSGLASGRIVPAYVTRAQYDAAPARCRCIERSGWAADITRSPRDLSYARVGLNAARAAARKRAQS